MNQAMTRMESKAQCCSSPAAVGFSVPDTPVWLQSGMPGKPQHYWPCGRGVGDRDRWGGRKSCESLCQSVLRYSAGKEDTRGEGRLHR